MAFEPIERFTLRSSLIKAFELATKASLPESCCTHWMRRLSPTPDRIDLNIPSPNYFFTFSSLKFTNTHNY